MNLAFIPSPPESEWFIGPFPIRAYALCIIAGVIVAAVVGNRRWVARGGQHGTVYDITIWAVPFGLVGARLYHVLTDWQLYFAEGADPWRAFAIWDGGLGIWGGIALGTVGGWIACRRRGIPFPAMADTVAPAIALAQAIGRWGNWFNQELYGKPSTLPWAVEIAPERRIDGFEQYETFQPTFLYESLWDIGVALLVIWAAKRFALGHGRAFAVYVAAYTLGRGWIEYLRIDPVNEVFGLRLNVWTSILVFLGAAVYIVVSAWLRPGVETEVEPAAESEPSESEPAASDQTGSDEGEQAEPDQSESKT